MPLSITSVTRINGPACSHVTATVDHEGTTRVFQASLGEIDDLLSEMTPLQQLRMLVLLWAKYRRMQGRAVEGVTIA